MTRGHRTARKKRSLSVRLLWLPSLPRNPQCKKVHIWTAPMGVVGFTEVCHMRHTCIRFSLGWQLTVYDICDLPQGNIARHWCINWLCLLQLLQQCLLWFPCLPQKVLPWQISQLRVKQSWKPREELGKRLRGPPNRARRERWGNRLPRANLKHSRASCSQVLSYPGGQHNLKLFIMYMWRKTCFSCVFSVVKRLPEHVQVDNPEVLKKLAKKLERQQVGFFMCHL